MTANTAIAEAYRSETNFSMHRRETLGLWVCLGFLALGALATLTVVLSANLFWLVPIGLLAAFSALGLAYSYFCAAIVANRAAE